MPEVEMCNDLLQRVKKMTIWALLTGEMHRYCLEGKDKDEDHYRVKHLLAYNKRKWDTNLRGECLQMCGNRIISS